MNVEKMCIMSRECLSCDCYIDRKNLIGICRICKRCNICGGHISSNSKKGKCKKCLGEYIKGDKNPNWKNNGLCYGSIHRWIRKYYGKANRCDNYPNCIWKNPHHYEWANLSGKYNKDRNDWKMLCVSCHVRMDRAKRNKK